MFLVVLCATIAVAVLVYMMLGTRPGKGAQQRRFPRLDLSVPVHIHTDDEKHLGESKNISGGGMLLSAQAPVSIAQPIRLKFSLPTDPATDDTHVEIPAVVSFKKGEQIGVRFDPTHHNRIEIENWIQHSRSAIKEEKRPEPPESAATTANT